MNETRPDAIDSRIDFGLSVLKFSRVEVSGSGVAGKSIAFLSSVNVGRKNRLKAHELEKAAEEAGIQGAKSVLQSGNVVFDGGSIGSDVLRARMEDYLRSVFDVEATVFVCSQFGIERLIKEVPWKDDPSKTHVFLHRHPIDATGEARLSAAAVNGEQMHFCDDFFWLYAPNGMARSKIESRAPQLAGQPTTAQSMSSLEKILAVAQRQ